MVDYSKVNLKVLSLHLSKLKSAVKNNNGTALRIGNKNLNKDELLHELYLTQRQITNLRNKIENNMSYDIKLSKPQIKKIKSGSIRSFRINLRQIFTKID